MQLVEVFILAIHLILVGIGACLPLAVVLLNRKMLRIDNSRHCDAIWQFSRGLMKVSIQAVTLGSIFGLLLAGVLWSEDFHNLCHLVLTKMKWAGVEWLFSMLVFGGIYFQWAKSPGAHRAFRIRSVLIFLAAFNLLYHFPSLFLVITAIPADVVDALTRSAIELSRDTYYEIMFSSTMISRWLHATLAMLATSMVFVAVASIRRANQEDEGPARDSAISICRWAARNVLLILFLQFAFGIWTVVAMDPSRMENLMGANMAATGLFAISIILLFVQLQQWTGLISERVRRDHLVRAVATYLTMFMCMVAASVLS